MRLLLFLVLLLLPLSAFAQSTPPPMPSSTNDSVTVIHPAPGVEYYYDQRGNSSTVYQQAPGMQWYSTEDRHGTITSQGYLFDPMPVSMSLEVPWSSPPEHQERRR
jgi:hypothetical protein